MTTTQSSASQPSALRYVFAEAAGKAEAAATKIHLIIDTVPVMIWTTGADGRCDFVSRRWLDYTGLTAEQALGRGWTQAVHPDDIEQTLIGWRSALAEVKPFEAEQRIRRSDGQYRWFLSRAFPMRDPSGHVLGWAGNDIDIHDRRRAEERLRRSEAYLQEAQRLGRIGCFVRDIPSRITFVSPELLRIFGLCSDQDARSVPCSDQEAASKEILIEMPDHGALIERIHPEDRPLFDELKNRASSQTTAYELDYRIVLPDGSIKHCHQVAHPVFAASGELVEYVGMIIDVTERKRAAQVLEWSENRLRAMVEKSAEGIMLVVPDKGIVYASPSIERVLGYTPEELAGRTSQWFVEHVIHPDYRQYSLENWTRLLLDRRHVSTREVMALHKDGSWRWIESTMRNLLREPSVQALVVNIRDITECKRAQAERERLEQRLRQAEKMEAVGRLAGGVAHDFNNVLAGVFAYGEMLFEEAPGDSPLKRYAQNVLAAASRGRELVEQILAYSRSQRGKRVPVDVAKIVAESLELIRGSLPASIQLEVSAPEAPQVVIGDATQLHQVVMNLCSNAVHAMSAGGTLRVVLDTADVSGERTLSHGTLQQRSYVQLTVGDCGSGMDGATLARIFEPFFTTKEVGHGTGLGLSLVYAIVTDSGGAIDVKSAPGRGSTFTIYLTRADVALSVTEAATAPLPRGGGERELLVDEEAPLLAVTAEVLPRLGYDAIPLDDGRAVAVTSVTFAQRLGTVQSPTPLSLATSPVVVGKRKGMTLKSWNRKRLAILACLGALNVAYAAAAADEPKPSGAIEIASTSVAVGVGVVRGDGTLHYQNANYMFSVHGLSVADVGISSITTTGDRAEGPVVQTAEAVVRGLVRDGVSVFQWIPFAAKVRHFQGTPNADGPYVTGSAGTRPIVDGTIVPVEPDAAITTGRFDRMPIMGGRTRDEGPFFNEVQRAQQSHWVIIATIIDRTTGKPIRESKLGGPELEFDDPVRCKAVIDQAHPTPTDRAATVLTCRKVQPEAIGRPSFY
jgi:PAS domain S-box-containing protein